MAVADLAADVAAKNPAAGDTFPGHPEEYGANWYATTMVTAPDRPRLTLDLDVDVCVVGGGLAGLTIAREVARKGWSVAVIETKRVAWNASGRNCGFVVPGFGQSVERVVERVGLDHAKALWALSEAGVDHVRNAIRELNMPGVDPVDGWLDVSKSDNGDQLLALVSLLGQEFGTEVEGWPTERVRAVLKSESYFHAVHFPKAFHIHALNYALGLAAAAEQAGARIFENTPALQIDPAGVRKRVVTPAARVRSAHIVLAGSVHLGNLSDRVAGTLVPVTTYAAVTAPLGDRLAEAVTYRGAVSDTRSADNHYRIVGGDRLMWAGGLSTWDGNPAGFASRFARDIARVYPQLGNVSIDHVWSGLMGHSVHHMPQIGEVSPGLWLASAFGGHGINTTAMAGELIASALVEGDDRWKLFLPYALVWSGGTLGRAAFQVAYWTRRKGEAWAAQLAQRRDVKRRMIWDMEPIEGDINGATVAMPQPALEQPAATKRAPRREKKIAAKGRQSRQAKAVTGETQVATAAERADQASSTEGAV
jgi:gamma-glutamylputrescine oxidase